MSKVTNLTELAEFFPEGVTASAPQRLILVAPRFWMPGDSYEQALARKQESWDRLQAKIAAKRSKA